MAIANYANDIYKVRGIGEIFVVRGSEKNSDNVEDAIIELPIKMRTDVHQIMDDAQELDIDFDLCEVPHV